MPADFFCFLIQLFLNSDLFFSGSSLPVTESITSAWRKVELLVPGGQEVSVNDFKISRLCPREAERGDHGQEDLVLHPGEKPTSG